MNPKRVALFVAATVFAMAGCGSTSQEHGYFDMTRLAAALKTVAVKRQGGESVGYPTSVTCAKTGALEASCVLTLKGERFNEATTIAPDGNTYEQSYLTPEASSQGG